MQIRHPIVRHLKLAFLVVLLAIMAGPAAATGADDLVVALNYPGYYDSVAGFAVEASLARLKSDAGLNDAQLAAARATLQADIATHKKAFLASVAAAYAAKFTDAECTELAAFYGSPLGKKVAASQDDMQDQVARLTRELGMQIGASAAALRPAPAPSH